ncbi:MAG: TrbC/VirB2 family protein [Proteobacteria bacterium]|nr:TrbC/VirB2 family protein [Pseudomonadota bacterium]
MGNSRLRNWVNRLGLYFLSMVFTSSVSFAGRGGNLPFTSTMNTIKDAVSGPFLLAASVIMVVVTCLMLAFGEWGDGFKKLINMVLWLSIAFAASGFITSVFG